MHVHWEHKKQRSAGMSNPAIDELLRAGAAQRRAGRQADRRRRRRFPDVLHRRQNAPAPRACARPGCARCGSASISRAPRSWRSLDCCCRSPFWREAWPPGCGRSPTAFPKPWWRSTASPSSRTSCACCAREGSAAWCSASATWARWSANSPATAAPFGLEVEYSFDGPALARHRRRHPPGAAAARRTRSSCSMAIPIFRATTPAVERPSGARKDRLS